MRTYNPLIVDEIGWFEYNLLQLATQAQASRMMGLKILPPRQLAPQFIQRRRQALLKRTSQIGEIPTFMPITPHPIPG
ncbi:hypothetical protein IQ266_24900 [filamentous cyanobacterium LEGE 11480]|uniref:Uncharacterized protein n=1 Tax=Romeriopsis navalis LEGE 11480 TaxID=2777977 RepID=A0A928VUT9_9CYAN|nr:hypothetical protein [Romeriopsis navalis]MBE9032980.1 hypothetical protein [Romeriopsis navalis LEGE 11480]